MPVTRRCRSTSKTSPTPTTSSSSNTWTAPTSTTWPSPWPRTRRTSPSSACVERTPTTVHCVCTPSVANLSATLYLQRTLYIRAQYKFDLSWAFALLEPGDIVELTDAGLGLAAYPVRITQIDEDEKGVLSLTCEDLLVGVSHAPLYTMQTGVGTQTNQNVDPGGVEANLLLNSQDFTGAWTLGNVTITAAATTDPITGASDAQKITPNTSNVPHNVHQPVTTFSNANYTFSAYLKAAGYNFAAVEISDFVANAVYLVVDLSAGVIDSQNVVGTANIVSASIVSAGAGWYRVAVTCQLAATTIHPTIGPLSTSAFGAFAGNGTSGVYAWGCNFTQGVDVRPYAVTTTAIAGPLIFNPPSSLTQSQGGRETWAAVAGGAFWGGANVWVSLDGGSTYEMIGTTQQGGARFGQLTAAYASGSDPDTTDTLSVDLSASNGALTSAADPVADQSGTLCLVDGTELISFSTATLTGPNRYNLTTYIRRGLPWHADRRPRGRRQLRAARQRDLRFPVPGHQCGPDGPCEVPEL